MMIDDDLRERARDMIHAEIAESEGLEQHWLSFADPERPEGQRFLGVAIVEAHGPAHAHALTHEYGINPGGEMAGKRVRRVPRRYMNRLLTRAETQEMTDVPDDDERDEFEARWG